MKKNKNIKNADAIFLLIFILVISMCVFIILKPKFEYKKLINNINIYQNDDNYDFLYFDEDISYETQNSYKEYVNKHIYLTSLIRDNNLKIVISNDSIANTANKLFETNKDYNNSFVGLYFDKYNLIIMKNYDAENVKIDITDSIRNTAEGDYKEFIKDKDSYYLKELYSKEELNNLNNKFNSNVFYHELGHFIVDKEGSNLLNKDLFEKEKDLIFNSNEKNYIKSSLNEYIAECISNYLNYGYVEYPNKELVKNSTGIGNSIDLFFNDLRELLMPITY